MSWLGERLLGVLVTILKLIQILDNGEAFGIMKLDAPEKNVCRSKGKLCIQSTMMHIVKTKLFTKYDSYREAS